MPWPTADRFAVPPITILPVPLSVSGPPETKVAAPVVSTRSRVSAAFERTSIVPASVPLPAAFSVRTVKPPAKLCPPWSRTMLCAVAACVLKLALPATARFPLSVIPALAVIARFPLTVPASRFSPPAESCTLALPTLVSATLARLLLA